MILIFFTIINSCMHSSLRFLSLMGLMVLLAPTPWSTTTLYLVMVVGQLQSQLPSVQTEFAGNPLLMKSLVVALLQPTSISQYQLPTFLELGHHQSQLLCIVRIINLTTTAMYYTDICRQQKHSF